MIELRKLTNSDIGLGSIAWFWMRCQPERYADCDGYDDFKQFWNRPDETKVAIVYCGKITAYCWFVFCGGEVEFGMVTPPERIPVWPLVRALRFLQKQFQQQNPQKILTLESRNPAALTLSDRLGLARWGEHGAMLLPPRIV